MSYLTLMSRTVMLSFARYSYLIVRIYLCHNIMPFLHTPYELWDVIVRTMRVTVALALHTIIMENIIEK